MEQAQTTKCLHLKVSFMPGTLSVVSSLNRARNTTSYCYQGHSSLPTIQLLLNNCAIQEGMLPPAIRAILQVCFLYNCRISELLSCYSNHVIHPDRLLCLGKKRSGSYIIFLPGLSHSMMGENKKSIPYQLFPITYKKLWTWCVRVHIIQKKRSGLNNNVTHVSRFKIAEEIINKFSEPVASDILRHRSLNSISYYTK